jgi:hypothetical protein
MAGGLATTYIRRSTLLQMKVRRRKRVLAALGIATLVGSTTVLVSAVGATTSGAAQVRPAAAPAGSSGKVKSYSNKLNRNTKGWCTYAEGCNGQVGSGDYGTIDVVPESYSNDGGYAPSVPGPGKLKAYARISGAGNDQDSVTGCSSPGDENCTGPYVLYGGTGTDSKFPTNGFDSSISVYLDSSWAAANPGQVIDWDVSLNNNTGSFVEDFVFNLCSTANDGGGFYVSASNNAGGCSTGPSEVTQTGWYTLETFFAPYDGQVTADYILVNPDGSRGFYDFEESGIATADAGGPNYGWFPDEDVLGLPISSISLTPEN